MRPPQAGVCLSEGRRGKGALCSRKRAAGAIGYPSELRRVVYSLDQVARARKAAHDAWRTGRRQAPTVLGARQHHTYLYAYGLTLIRSFGRHVGECWLGVVGASSKTTSRRWRSSSPSFASRIPLLPPSRHCRPGGALDARRAGRGLRSTASRGDGTDDDPTARDKYSTPAATGGQGMP